MTFGKTVLLLFLASSRLLAGAGQTLHDPSFMGAISHAVSGPTNIISGIAGYYTFNEGTAGAAIIDSSGNGNNATPVGSPVYVAGKIGPYALSFNGTSQYATAGTTGYNFQDNTPWSVSCWIKTSATASLQVIASTWNVGSAAGWFLDCNNTSPGDFSVGMKNASGSQWRQVVTTGGLVSDGSWHFVVATYAGTGAAAGFTMYVDGSVQSAVNTVDIAPGTLSSATLTIAALQGASLGFNGSIDDFRTFNRVLFASEVTYLFSTWTGP